MKLIVTFRYVGSVPPRTPPPIFVKSEGEESDEEEEEVIFNSDSNSMEGNFKLIVEKLLFIRKI